MRVSHTAITSLMTEQTDPYAWKPRQPLSERLIADQGTKKAPTARQQATPTGITAGLADMAIKIQKPVKHLRTDQKKGKHFVEGHEAGSEAEDCWIEEQEQPGIGGLTGQEKHFLSMLNNDELTDNFF